MITDVVEMGVGAGMLLAAAANADNEGPATTAVHVAEDLTDASGRFHPVYTAGVALKEEGLAGHGRICRSAAVCDSHTSVDLGQSLLNSGQFVVHAFFQVKDLGHGIASFSMFSAGV